MNGEYLNLPIHHHNLQMDRSAVTIVCMENDQMKKVKQFISYDHIWVSCDLVNVVQRNLVL
uniref:Plastocyanin-like domain-containing protein n=1 Tax=Elaeophora elaphi TaxID=1147741 RepID=A0A0R3S368_9BILA